METLTKHPFSILHLEHFAVPGNPKLVGQWQRGLETMSGQAQWKLHLTFAHSPSPAFQQSTSKTAMTAMSILAMAMVICLFGGYVDSPNEHRLSRAARQTQR